MSQPTRPQGTEEKETPWRVQFTCKKKQPTPTEIKKDLLIACWGNAKMADLLYHFLCVGSWKAYNCHIPETTRTVVLHEKYEDIKDKLNVKFSAPMMIDYIKRFVVAGYLRKVARKEALEVNFETIEAAFTNPPDKPIPSKNFSSNLTLSVNSTSEEKTEIQLLRDEVKNMAVELQNLTLTLVQVKLDHAQSLHELNINFSSTLVQILEKIGTESASQAASDNCENSLVISNISNSVMSTEGKKDDCANAPLTLPFTQEEIALIVRSRIPAGDAILLERLEHGSHRIYRKSGLPIGELIPVGVDVSEGLLALITVDSTAETTIDTLPEGKISYSHNLPQAPVLEQNTENTGIVPGAGYKTNTDANTSSHRKETKRNSRSRKPKVEQPPLIDTNNKAVAFSDEEQVRFNWYCHLDFIRVTPVQNAKRKEHSAKLIQFVQSQEEMTDLAAFAKDHLNDYLRSQRKPEVYVVPMGYLANEDTLNAWLAQKDKKANKPAQKSTATVYDLDEERQKREREEEKNQRNLEANRQASIASMQEKLARGAKLLNFEVVMAVESYGLTLPPQYMAQYNASKQVAVSQ